MDIDKNFFFYKTTYSEIFLITGNLYKRFQNMNKNKKELSYF